MCVIVPVFAPQSFALLRVLLPFIYFSCKCALGCLFLPQRWFVNADVQCFSGWHIDLALLAIITLLVCLLAMVATVILTYKVYAHNIVIIV